MPSGVDPRSLPGVVVDDREAELKGAWKGGTTKKKYIGYSYRYASGNSDATATYTVKVKEAGRYVGGVRTAPFDNRSTSAPVEVQWNGKTLLNRVIYQGSEEGEFAPVGTIEVQSGETVKVIVSCKDTKGIVHLDAVQLLREDESP